MTEVLKVIWVGAMVGAVLKLGSPHPRWSSWVFAAFVGSFGAMLGLFVSRLLGVPREHDKTTLAVCGGIAAIVVVTYAWVSEIAMRRLRRRAGKVSRPPTAF